MNIKVLLLLLSIGLLYNCSSSKWVAPEKANPQEILFEARDDAENKQYEVALLKYIWIHEHSLKYDYDFYGVRNSYALDEWYALGEKYPLANKKFHEYRNKAKQKVKNKKDIVQSFGDFQSFNNVVRKQEETINLFLWAEENIAFIIPSFYIFVRDDLFEAGKFDILNKYINPSKDYNNSEKAFKIIAELNNGKIDESSKSMFITEIQQLVIILQKNNRIKEAQEIISKASLVITDPRFKMAMESILDN